MVFNNDNNDAKYILTPWQGGRTLKPTASTESTKSRPPPPGCIINDLSVDDDHHDHHHQIYKCLNFFVSQPIIFIFGHIIGMARARVVMEPDFRILMLAGNGRAQKYVFRDCGRVF